MPLRGKSQVAQAFTYRWCNLQASCDERICALQKRDSRHPALLQQRIRSSYLNDQLAKQRLCPEQRERQNDPCDREDDSECDDGEPYEWRRRSENVHCVLPFNATLDYRCRRWFRMATLRATRHHALKHVVAKDEVMIEGGTNVHGD